MILNVKKGTGPVAGTARRVLRTTGPVPFFEPPQRQKMPLSSNRKMHRFCDMENGYSFGFFGNNLKSGFECDLLVT
jgi:hypothetical protein